MTGTGYPRQLQSLPSCPVEYSLTLFDLASAFNPLRSGCLIDYQVTSVRDGVAIFSVAMPDGMVNAFASMLESQVELFKLIDNKQKVKAAESRVFSLDALNERQQYRDGYERLIVETFDRLFTSGVSRSDAISATNKSLKQQGHPWANYDNVQRVLRASGRMRTVQRAAERGNAQN